MTATALQRKTNSRTSIAYAALITALHKRGECKVSESDNIEVWTRTYSSKRDENGNLRPLETSNPSWYYVSNDLTASKFYVWVGRTQESAGKLNTGSREYLIEEGRSNG